MALADAAQESVTELRLVSVTPFPGDDFEKLPGRTGEVTDSVSVLLVEAPLLSVTITVTSYDPVPVGFPEMVPLSDMARGEGSPVAVHVYGLVPPDAVKVVE